MIVNTKCHIKLSTKILSLGLIQSIILYSVTYGNMQDTKLNNQNAFDSITNTHSHNSDNKSTEKSFVSQTTTAIKLATPNQEKLIGIGAFNWLQHLPTIGINQNVSLQVNTGITSSKTKPHHICADRICPYADSLCDIGCRDYGKSGGRFAYKDTETGDRRLSCLCFCDAPWGSRSRNGTISPCMDSSVCDDLCKNKCGIQYPLGGSCVRNVCKCACGIEEKYEPTSPFLYPEVTSKP